MSARKLMYLLIAIVSHSFGYSTAGPFHKPLKLRVQTQAGTNPASNNQAKLNKLLRLNGQKRFNMPKAKWLSINLKLMNGQITKS